MTRSTLPTERHCVRPELSYPITIVRALLDYESSNPTDLSFTTGQLVFVLIQLNCGWWQGRCNETQGWFPCSFVEPLEWGTLVDRVIHELVSMSKELEVKKSLIQRYKKATPFPQDVSEKDESIHDILTPPLQVLDHVFCC